MEIAKKLKEMMLTAGFRSQVALSRASGIPQPTISRILNGDIKNPDLKTIKTLADACNQSIGVLLDNMRSVQVLDSNAPPLDAVRIKHIRISVEAGITGFEINQIDPTEELSPTYITGAELVKNGWKGENLFKITVHGKSMEPGIFPGDIVLVNTAEREPKDGQVYILNFEGEVVIKRLFRESGRWIARSDNADKTRYPDRNCSEQVFIIGKIVRKTSKNI